MPRTTRIEYSHAFYHVMNRGKGKSDIFHDKKYYQSFLEILAQANQKFGAIIHAYCLMDNHYHLLLETPLANLSRIMRHINGVYTQKYNKLRKYRLRKNPCIQSNHNPTIVLSYSRS